MLKIKGLVKVFPGPVAALQGIDLEIDHGMFGLLGPNGAGKTTLMRILAGLLEPTSGEASLDGADLVDRTPETQSRIGYLPQEFGFYPHLTGQAMLSYLLTLKGVSTSDSTGRRRATNDLVHELLERVNLSYAARRKVKTYSGGMRQRLGIAQAIAGDPRLIIADEPTAGLDPEERIRFYRLLAELAETRIVLLSTHIVEDVSVLCPRFAMIRAGKLVARMTPKDAREALTGRIYEGSVAPEKMPEFQNQYRVTQALLVEGRNRVRVYCGNGDVPPEFQSVPPTLEDAYLVTMKQFAEAVDAETTVGDRS